MSKEGKDQPSSEFTKKFRELIKLSEEHLSDNKIGRLQTYGKEACKIIDTSEASRKELLEAGKAHKKVVIEGYGNTFWMSNYSDMEAAIAKSEKEQS